MAYPLSHFASRTDYDERWDSPPMVSHLAARDSAPGPAPPTRIRVAAAIVQRMSRVAPIGTPRMSEKVLLRLRTFAVAATQHWAVTTLRCSLNFWVTSCRMHIGEPGSCLYGCRASDHFAHYLTCPFIRSAVSSITGRDVGGASVSDCFGICDGDGAADLEEAFKRAALATFMYHVARTPSLREDRVRGVSQHFAGVRARRLARIGLGRLPGRGLKCRRRRRQDWAAAVCGSPKASSRCASLPETRHASDACRRSLAAGGAWVVCEHWT